VLRGKAYSQINLLFRSMRAESLGADSGAIMIFCISVLGAKTVPRLSAPSGFSRIYRTNLLGRVAGGVKRAGEGEHGPLR
jgi:hypothetical protein